MPPRSPVILLIGNDSALSYLIERYAARSGYEIHAHLTAPAPSHDPDSKPAALLFGSIEDLEAAQDKMGQLSRAEIPLLVCVSVNDQLRASELGADQCLVHPLTYDGFLAALAAAHVVRGKAA